MARQLKLIKGSTTIDLLSMTGTGFFCVSWEPQIPSIKDDGVFADSKMSEGRRPVYSQRSNVIDNFKLAGVGSSRDNLIASVRQLQQFFEGVANYWKSNTDDDIPYILAQAEDETNARYAILVKGDLNGLSEHWESEFVAGGSAFNQNVNAIHSHLTLTTEHQFWLGSVPGVGTARQISTDQTIETNKVWSVLTALPSSTYRMIQTTTGRIIVGDTNAVQISDDNGVNWSTVAIAGAGWVRGLVQLASGRILAGYDSAISLSDDDGDTWSPTTATPASYIMCIIQLSNARILAVELNNAVWISDNNGADWSSVVPGVYLAHDLLQTDTGRILLTGTDTNPLTYSDDNGNTWHPISCGIYSGGALVQCTSGCILIGDLNKIWRSDDDGDTTYPVITGLNTALYGLLQLSNGDVLAGDSGQIIRTGDDGISWYLEFNSPTGTAVSFLETAADYILAGTMTDVWGRGPISEVSLGRTATNTDENFVANKWNTENISHVFVDDGGVFGTNLFPMASFPTVFLPASPAIDDAVYFGSETSSPFFSLVFDLSSIIQCTTSYAIIWEYSDGAAGWPALTVKDGTDPMGGTFMQSGVCSVHWTPPSGWVEEAVSGVTGLWVRARVSALVGTMTAPAQDNRDIYSVTWPDVNMVAAQAAGDLPLIARIELHNRSDRDGNGSNAPNLWTSRLVSGLRSYSRGSTFTSFLNCSDVQNPIGVTFAVGTNSALADDVQEITGRSCTWTAAIADTVFSDRATITLGSTIASHFYGVYHAFVRAETQDADFAAGDIVLRLQIRTGSGGVTQNYPKDGVAINSKNTWNLLDMGQVQIPASGLLNLADLGDSTVIAVQGKNGSGAEIVVKLHDVILIPVDEWACDTMDEAWNTNSMVGKQGDIDHYLDLDSISNPKVDLRTMVRTVGSNWITSIYKPIAPGKAVLQPNAQQRLWFLAAKGFLGGTHTGADNAAVLTDDAANFLAAGVRAGMVVYNKTDGSSATITAVTATTVTGTLAGGTQNDWDTNDVYNILCPNWTAPPELVHSVQVSAQARYLAYRGAT